jgi:hypothetical protein
MLISGPINIIRLTGTINNINITIYILVDYHSTINRQTECESYNNIDIVNYLKKLFKKSDKTIDFFFEIKNKYITDYADLIVYFHSKIALLYYRILICSNRLSRFIGRAFMILIVLLCKLVHEGFR